MREIQEKLRSIRELLKREGVEALRLRGVDWFAWATGGGDSSVIFSNETGVAEVLVTSSSAFVLTNEIERARMIAEQLPSDFEVPSFPWARPEEMESFVRSQAEVVVSDRPQGRERPLHANWLELKWTLLDTEVERYRALGRDAASAAREALAEARPDWTEWQLAGAAASACWKRGIHPLLTLVSGERRLPIHRHPVATSSRLDARAMLVICGRRHGLFANLTRFVSFREPTAEEKALESEVAEVEAEAFAATSIGLSLPEVYERIRGRYAALGRANEIEKHHQGGPTGYLSREAVARPGLTGLPKIGGAMAFAWNPSLPGMKIEDTVLRHPDGRIEILTADPDWPTFSCQGKQRPAVWVRSK